MCVNNSQHMGRRAAGEGIYCPGSSTSSSRDAKVTAGWGFSRLHGQQRGKKSLLSRGRAGSVWRSVLSHIFVHVPRFCASQYWEELGVPMHTVDACPARPVPWMTFGRAKQCYTRKLLLLANGVVEQSQFQPLSHRPEHSSHFVTGTQVRPHTTQLYARVAHSTQKLHAA